MLLVLSSLPGPKNGPNETKFRVLGFRVLRVLGFLGLQLENQKQFWAIRLFKSQSNDDERFFDEQEPSFQHPSWMWPGMTWLGGGFV
jgi:hypothetical protein